MLNKKFIGDDKGSTGVEFGFVAPVFIVFLLSVFYLGTTVMKLHSMHYALVEGARVVQLNASATAATVQKSVNTKMTTLTGGGGVTVSLNTAKLVNGSALTTISATYPVTFSVPMIGDYTYSYTTSLTVTGSAT